MGLVTLDCQVLTVDNHTETLVIFTATPDSEDAQRLALLYVIGTQLMRIAVDQLAERTSSSGSCGFAYHAVQPPSTRSTAPVTLPDASHAR